MLGSFGTENWVKQGENSTEWEGGLLRVTSGSTEVSEVEYIDMYRSCKNFLVPCNVFKRLRDAGAAFCFFDVISYCFTIVWMAKVAFLYVQKEIFVKVPVLVWPSCGLVFHILAEIIWSGVTKAKFLGTCTDVTSESLCSTRGPAIVLTVTCLYIVAFAMFFIVHLKRFVPDDNKEELDLERKD